MAITYILVDAQKRATLIPESRIQAEATARMVKGEKFEIYRAEPMQLEINLSPADAPTRVGGGGRSRRVATPRRQASTRGGARRVGRPKVNVGPCTVPGCKRTAKTRGLCSAHYQQHRRLVRQGKPGLIGAGAGKAPKAAKATRTPRKKAAKKRATGKRAARKTTARKATARKTSRKAAKKPAAKKTRTTQGPKAPAPTSSSES